MRPLEILLLLVALLVAAGVLAGAWLMLAEVTGALRRALATRFRPRSRRRSRRSRDDPWARVVLPHDVKEELQMIQRILRAPGAYQKRWGQTPPRGMILHGPPGTGKTLIARALARGAGYHVLNVATADVKDKYLGESERRVRELYRRAREAAPCIVFLDEIEGLASRRSSTDDDSGGAARAQNSLISQLLQEIDGFSQARRPVFTVGATNHLELVDEALLSRLSYQLHIRLPDAEARRQLFERFTGPYSARLDYPLAALVEASAGLSGRDIETLCSLATMIAHGRARASVGHEEWRRAFARLNRALPAPNEACPGCSGDDPNCPFCQGRGSAEAVFAG